MVVLAPKASGVPDIDGVQEATLAEAPLLPTDQATAMWQQSRILEALEFDQRSALLVIPYYPEKVNLPIQDYFKTWSEVEKKSWRVQMEGNFLRQQQVFMGFPRLEHAPLVPPGYEHLTQPLSLFLQDNPDYPHNVFLMTRFADHPSLLQAIDVLRGVLKRHGYYGLRADDKAYVSVAERYLWNNVCVYMIGCSRGIVVLEDVVQDDFNPNIAIEYGFLRALNKPVLVLRDRNFKRLAADVSGIIYETFDLLKPSDTLREPVGKWLRETEMTRSPTL